MTCALVSALLGSAIIFSVIKLALYVEESRRPNHSNITMLYEPNPFEFKENDLVRIASECYAVTGIAPEVPALRVRRVRWFHLLFWRLKWKKKSLSLLRSH